MNDRESRKGLIIAAVACVAVAGLVAVVAWAALTAGRGQTGGDCPAQIPTPGGCYLTHPCPEEPAVT